MSQNQKKYIADIYPGEEGELDDDLVHLLYRVRDKPHQRGNPGRETRWKQPFECQRAISYANGKSLPLG